MKKHFFILMSVFCLNLMGLESADAQTFRQVINLGDWRAGETFDEGILRCALHAACHSPGDDIITFVRRFEGGPMTISLVDPLVVPQDCQGRVEFRGLEDTDVILNGSGISGGGGVEGDSCTLMIYADNNLVTNLTFTGHARGAGVCIFGANNRIAHNRFGETRAGGRSSNRYGIVLSNQAVSTTSDALTGSANTIEANYVGPGSFSGIVDRASANTILQNVIENPLENGILLLGEESQARENTVHRSGGPGITVEGQSLHVVRNQIEDSFGPGIFMNGTHNTVEANTIQNSRDHGVDMRGSGNFLVNGNQIVFSSKNGLLLTGQNQAVQGNRIASSGWAGIWALATDSKIASNRIVNNGGCPIKKRFETDKGECSGEKDAGGPGILINPGSVNLLVGGESFDNDRNIIQYNMDGGVIVLGGEETVRHHITHNTISKNYGPEPDLDLLGDGLTLNDVGDTDQGVNTLLNTVEYIQAFPLTPSPAGLPRYWTYGLARSGDEVEIYGVSDEDRVRGRFHGGGDIFYGDSPIRGRGFRIQPSTAFSSANDQLITALTFDALGNTSEFALNTLAGSDADLDGIVDSRETSDGTPTSVGSSSVSTDTDHDGLPDTIEDRSRNGRWDSLEGETSAYNADSDGDGLNDWVETHGDGSYQPGFDTDPLNPDTDGDGVWDGTEDANHNGIWDRFANESSPVILDSDADGIIDSRDNCPGVPNPSQEAWHCRR